MLIEKACRCKVQIGIKARVMLLIRFNNEINPNSHKSHLIKSRETFSPLTRIIRSKDIFHTNHISFDMKFFHRIIAITLLEGVSHKPSLAETLVVPRERHCLKSSWPSSWICYLLEQCFFLI